MIQVKAVVPAAAEVAEQMVKQGFTPEEIGKVGGGNFCRVFDAATVGHA